jgi:hypothetical protein
VNSDDVRVFVAPQRDARTASICLVSDLQALAHDQVHVPGSAREERVATKHPDTLRVNDD